MLDFLKYKEVKFFNKVLCLMIQNYNVGIYHKGKQEKIVYG